MNATNATDRLGSLEEIATDLDLTRERVRLIEFVALLECRRSAMSKGDAIKDLIGEEINHESLLSDGDAQ